MSGDLNAERSQNFKIDNIFFERMKQFRYLGTTLTKQIPFRKKLRAD
jgi:hypothetical protein